MRSTGRTNVALRDLSESSSDHLHEAFVDLGLLDMKHVLANILTHNDEPLEVAQAAVNGLEVVFRWRDDSKEQAHRLQVITSHWKSTVGVHFQGEFGRAAHVSQVAA